MILMIPLWLCDSDDGGNTMIMLISLCEMNYQCIWYNNYISFFAFSTESKKSDISAWWCLQSATGHWRVWLYTGCQCSLSFTFAQRLPRSTSEFSRTCRNSCYYVALHIFNAVYAKGEFEEELQFLISDSCGSFRVKSTNIFSNFPARPSQILIKFSQNVN